MNVYADSSFVASLYLPDSHSDRAARWMAEFHSPISISPLVVLEVTNAAGLRAFRLRSDARATELALEKFGLDLTAGVWVSAPLPAEVWTVACRISRENTAVIGSRSLDILHVAVAIAAKAQAFLTFDRSQARLARAEGLATPMESDVNI